MTALFDLPRTPNPRKKRPTPDPQPRLGRLPRPTQCHCGANILESQPSISDVVTVDPYTLTPPAVLAHLHMRVPIYRAPLNQLDWTPTELIRAYPGDTTYFDHWKFYWLPAHQCGRPPTLPGYPLTVKPRKPAPTTPPY